MSTEKLSELSNNARKAANSFFNWSQMADCTSERVSCLTVEQLKDTSELLSALLAELETERASREQWQRNCQRTEERAERLDAMLTESVQALKAAEKRLATPVRLHRGALMVSAYAANSFNSEWHLCLARDSVVSAIRAAGFTVEGDGQ